MGRIAGVGTSAVAALVAATALAAAPAYAAPAWTAPQTISPTSNFATAGDPVIAGNGAGFDAIVWSNNGAGASRNEMTAVGPASGSFANENLTDPGTYGLSGHAAVDADGNTTYVWVPSTSNSVFVRQRLADGSYRATQTAGTGTVTTPLVAVAPDGTATVVWTEYFARWLVKARTIAPDGTLGTTQTLNDGDSHDGNNPAVAVDSDGNVTVAWSQSDVVTGGFTTSMIRARTLRASDSTWLAEETLSSDAAGYPQNYPHAGADGSGQMFVTWEGPVAGSGSSANIVHERTRAAGAGSAWGTEATLSPADRNANAPQLAVGADGSATAVWLGTSRSDSTDRKIQATTIASDGTVGAVEDIATASGGFDDPNVAENANGDTIVAWVSSNSTASADVLARVRPAGGSFGAEHDVSGAHTHGGFAPGVALDDQGNATVVWDQSYDGSSDRAVMVAGYDAAGPALGGLTVPITGAAGTTLSFSVSPSDAWSSVASTSWDFGDGTTASGANVTHRYCTPGGYDVTVTSTDGLGNTTVDTEPVDVTSGSCASSGGGGGGQTGGGGGGNSGTPAQPSNTTPSSPGDIAAQAQKAAAQLLATLQAANAAIAKQLGDLVQGLAASGIISTTFTATGPGHVDLAMLSGGTTSKRAAKGARSHQIVVAHGAKTFRHAGRARVKIHLTRQGKALLRRSHRLSLTIRSTFTPRGGTATTVIRHVTVKQRSKRHSHHHSH